MTKGAFHGKVKKRLQSKRGDATASTRGRIPSNTLHYTIVSVHRQSQPPQRRFNYDANSLIVYGATARPGLLWWLCWS